ncbi:MAG: ABC-2 transporter permease [Treponema sp.]|nr:ABC-2 transporter permease [Treponema sp.]
MKNFLNKEIKLCLAPINYIYLSFALMTFIPGYPRYVGFFFSFVSLLHLFSNAMLNKDLEYSMILPITKKDIVKSRCLLIAVYQVIFTLLSVPFALLFYIVMPSGNVAGIDANVAFYGIVLILMAICDFVFLTSFYKKATKPGIPFLITSIVFWVLYIICEFPIWTKDVFNIPFFLMLDSTDAASQIRQLPILAAGILIFIFGWILTYKVSAKRFEKVDL